MALIIHRCDCGHPVMFHLPNGHCLHCRTCTGVRRQPEPEVIPTWSNETMAPVTELVRPGEQWQRTFPPTCDCDACKEMYDNHGGVAA